MTEILLYWSHICVLQREERAFLARLADSLESEGISLKTRFFGLGCPEHMSEYLAQNDAVLPDIIVSADLEVFEDRRIFGKFSDTLYPAEGWLPLRCGAALDAARRDERLLPFLSIPLVYYTREAGGIADAELNAQRALAFGGINNSAAKTVTKAVWERCGKEAAANLLAQSLVSDMPIGAFQAVRQGSARAALVPSLYALRADGCSSFLRIPREGPLLIPSYFCARKSIPEALARRIAESILCRELAEFYTANGDMIVYPEYGQPRSLQDGERFICPSGEWLSCLDPTEFYALYCKFLPSAADPFSRI